MSLICGMVVSLIVNIIVLMENQELRRSYDESYQTYLSSFLINLSFSPPILKCKAIHIALEYGRWNEATLKGMEVTASLCYMKFDPGYIEYRGGEYVCHGGVEVLYEVTEPVSDYSPVCVEMWYGNVTYQYVWIVIVSQAGKDKSIPPPGLYYVDSATSEVIPYPLM